VSVQDIPSARSGQPGVTIDPEMLIISGLQIDDPMAIGLFQQAQEDGANLGQLAEQIFVLGARASAVTQSGKEAAGLNVAIERASSEVGRASADATAQINALVKAATGSDGTVMTSIDALLTQLATKVDGMVAGDDSPLKKSINTTMEDARRELTAAVGAKLREQEAQVARLLNPADPQSPLRSVAQDLKSVDESIKGIQSQLDRKKGADESAAGSTAKGRPYEDAAVAVLQLIASGLNEACEPTGDKPGKSGKAGDGVMEIRPTAGVEGRLVMEAKSGRMTANAWRAEAKNSMANRDAQVFLGLAGSDESMPTSGTRIWLEDPCVAVVRYEDGDSPDLVRALVHVLRGEAIEVVTQVGDYNRADLRAALDESITGLEAFSKLDNNLRLAAEKITASQKSSVALQEQTMARLTKAIKLLSPSVDESA
jgi:hypothetical protein